MSLIAITAVAGCAPPPAADNLEPAATGGAYEAQYRDIPSQRDDAAPLRSPQMNAARCLPAAGGSTVLPAALGGELLSRGDLVNLRLPDDTTFSGDYVISQDGTLKLPYLAPIAAQGRSTAQVVQDIRRGLHDKGFYDEAPNIALLVKDFAPATVGVSGAVFEPHTLNLGGTPGDKVDSLREMALGASTESRNLSDALRNAGGVRPDADLSAVRITRSGRSYRVDLRGMLDGSGITDVMLITGDEVHVPSRACFQEALMAPSPVSPPGISLFLSNLTQPASANATAAIGREVREVPYGTRFMQAVISANCVGGDSATSGHRMAALFSRNPMTGVSVVIQRQVEKMRTMADRDDFDPYLLPGDAIACYDSGVTSLTNIGRALGVFKGL